jgi:hypothetical protein
VASDEPIGTGHGDETHTEMATGSTALQEREGGAAAVGSVGRVWSVGSPSSRGGKRHWLRYERRGRRKK